MGYDLTQGDDYKTIFETMAFMEEYVGHFGEDTKRAIVSILCSAVVNDGDHLQVGVGEGGGEGGGVEVGWGYIRDIACWRCRDRAICWVSTGPGSIFYKDDMNCYYSLSSPPPCVAIIPPNLICLCFVGHPDIHIQRVAPLTHSLTHLSHFHHQRAWLHIASKYPPIETSSALA